MQTQAKNVILIGPMGSGKSSVGKRLAQDLGFVFFDSDKEIEKTTGADIPLIFELEGEAGFRKRETQALRNLCSQSPIVLATGGGSVLLEENRHLLSHEGLVIYLHASIDQILERTKRDRSRPLLQTDNPRLKLEQIMAEREPIYEALADYKIETDRHTVREVVQSIHRVIDPLKSGISWAFTR